MKISLLTALQITGAVALLFGPLLLLGLYVLADYFEWPIAGGILRILAAALTVEFVIGALVNIVLGVALIGLAVWSVQHFVSAWRFPGAGALTLFGLWRVGRGASIIRGWYEEGR